MTEKTVRLSIKSLFLWVVMSIAMVSLGVSAILSIYSQVNIYEEELESNVLMLGKLIGANSVPFIATNSPSNLEERMNSLATTKQVLNVHVYRINADDESVNHFAYYNKDGRLLIASQTHRLLELEDNATIDDGGDYVEVTHQIVDLETGTPVGWVYLRFSTVSYNSVVVKSIALTLSVMVLLAVLCFLLALRLQKVVTAPIEQLARFLQKTSRERNYSARTDIAGVKEIGILSDAVNVMMSRIQDYIQKQQEAEANHKALNASLEEIVSERTIALKDANQELIQTLEKLHQFQRQMVQNEKMASLGDMVAGVAHEVNTPIGLGVTASTMMLDRLKTVQDDYDNKRLKASGLKRFFDESNENLNIIYRNLNRAAELISSFKQVAVDQSSESSRTFCFAQLVNEILLSLQPRLKKLSHEVTVDCDQTLTVQTKAGPINQILINLIMNSLIHGFEGIENGQISISAELVTSNKLKLVYRDNGKGIPPTIRKKIFDPFVTTKRGQGGSGLGMHLVYNLVTQGLNGSISLSSEEGQGVEFVIIFPVKPANSK